jgi:glycosyltransferase involved in cell wall biosynthesis
MSKPPLTAIGGYAAYGRNLAKCLRSLGYEPHIIVLGRKNEDQQTDFGPIHQVRALCGRLGTAGYSIWSDSFARRVETMVSKREPFVVHGIGPYGLAGLRLKNEFRENVFLVTTYFTTLRDEIYWMVRGIVRSEYGWKTWLKYNVAGWFLLSDLFLGAEKRLLKACDAVIVHYHATQVMIQKDYGIDDAKFHKIPYYVEPFERVFQQSIGKGGIQGIASEEPLLLTVCRQDPRKGIDYWLHAVKKIVDTRKVRVVIIGGGELLPKHIKIARRLGIERYVTFTGMVADIRPYLERADIFVLPSLQEGSGSLSLLEAMQHGVPVVTTTCSGGLAEDVENDVNGLIVPPEDPAALAEATLKLLSDHYLYRKMRENALAAYHGKFSATEMGEALSRLYQSFGFFPK